MLPRVAEPELASPASRRACRRAASELRLFSLQGFDALRQ